MFQDLTKPKGRLKPPHSVFRRPFQAFIQLKSSELMFNDTAGSEIVNFQAQKDLASLVKNNETRNVNNDRTTTIGNNEIVTVVDDRAKTVQKNETASITQNRTKSVGQNETSSITQNQSISVGDNQSTSVGKD